MPFTVIDSRWPQTAPLWASRGCGASAVLTRIPSWPTTPRSACRRRDRCATSRSSSLASRSTTSRRPPAGTGWRPVPDRAGGGPHGPHGAIADKASRSPPKRPSLIAQRRRVVVNGLYGSFPPHERSGRDAEGVPLLMTPDIATDHLTDSMGRASVHPRRPFTLVMCW